MDSSINCRRAWSCLIALCTQRIFSKHITDNYIERIRALAFEYSKGVITDVQVKFSPTTHKKISLDDDIKDQDISAHSAANLNIADINNQSSLIFSPNKFVAR